MPRTVALDKQYFSELREKNFFYVDKTAFLYEWWKAGDTVTLITRPRRFGKTLMMSTVEHFFSTKYAGRSDLFEGLDVWKDAEMRALQGTYPVIFLSLANVKSESVEQMKHDFCLQIRKIFRQWDGLLDSTDLNDADRREFVQLRDSMTYADAGESINRLCEFIMKATGRKTIVLLDEYDTPLQEAWLGGFWDGTVSFLRSLFNATFKTNPNLDRAILTGVTRVSRESMFSDLNNLRVISTTTSKYETAFGFTEQEVFAAMDEYGLSDRSGVKRMYDGFTFGRQADIYNPWSVLNYLQTGEFDTWWANTSSNRLAGKLVREGSPELKKDFEVLLSGSTIRTKLDEQIVFDELDGSDDAVWSLLLAAGYLKVVTGKSGMEEEGEYELALTNGEVRRAMSGLVGGWFRAGRIGNAYGNFLKALMEDDLKFMNRFMNDVAIACFSSFDTGTHPSRADPERFYHGFVLGLLVELRNRYIVTSNGESGFGRYDVMLEPRNPEKDDAIIIEFKVHDAEDESDLRDTVAAALRQIEKRRYAQNLIERGIPESRIRCYGFAFEGKKVLIG